MQWSSIKDPEDRGRAQVKENQIVRPNAVSNITKVQNGGFSWHINDSLGQYTSAVICIGCGMNLCYPKQYENIIK